MRIKIFTVGRFSLRPLEKMAGEYAGRIRRYLPIEQVVLKRTEDFERHKKPGDFSVVLEATGRPFDSESFAKWLGEKQVRSVKRVLFLIGPGEGLPPEIKKQADLCLSLSSMTLQHELSLVVLLEQIYRACTILRGEPYHK